MADKTPYRAWTGSKPNVIHLRIFRSMCSRNVPEQLRKKLGDQSQTMVLIGYHLTSAYKLYFPNDDKLVINRDVLVDESKWWNWTQESVQHEQSYNHNCI